MKTLSNSTVSEARKSVPDLVVIGKEDDPWKLLSKAYSNHEGWMKSTKAMDVVSGVVLQVTTQQKNLDGTYVITDALAYVPGIRVLQDKDGMYYLWVR